MTSRTRINIAFMCFIVLPQRSFSQVQEHIGKGRIKAIIVDRETQESIPGANVILFGTRTGSVADESGTAVLNHVPVGSYALEIRCIGYASLTVADVIVRPARTTSIRGELQLTAIQGEEVTATHGFFQGANMQTASAAGFSSEEIRRSSVAGGDLSRVIAALPGVAKVDDQKNGLAVRGGSAMENAFYLDNIEIPNINHFPSQGSSGGAIGILNVDLIDEVTFHTGGFSSIYGDKLSSVMALNLRDGNRDEFDGQIDLNFAGFGTVLEGPLGSNRGSWLVSARRSYVDLVARMLKLEVTPWFADAQGKAVYDLNPYHQLTLLDVIGYDHNDISKDEGKSLEFPVFGTERHLQNTLGVNWRWLWSANGYSNTSLSYTASRFLTDFANVRTDSSSIKNNSYEGAITLRNVTFLRLAPEHAIEFGLDLKHTMNDYDNRLAAATDPVGNPTPAFPVLLNTHSEQLGAFLNWIIKPLVGLQITAGLRADYSSHKNRLHASPRLALTYHLSERTAITGSAGIFHQTLPAILLSQNSSNRDLMDLSATHYVVGLNHLLTEDARLTVELYHKQYSHMPLDPSQPSLFLLDELQYRSGSFSGHNEIVDNGRAFSRGVEVMVQKKLSRNLYGLASAALSTTRYRGYDNIWRNRVFDNRMIVSFEGGFKPNHEWEFTARWVYAGGLPYTPFNIMASEQAHSGVFDVERVNTERYPSYHSLNVRADKRFNFSSSSLVCYLSLWNVYDRKNVASYFWNEIENKPDTQYQWGMVPVFGLEYEF